ncbi:MAG: tetratricopeptide repeat protein, partial [Candidatus Daviesbacteria bacterium]|nr:tetratricopeptide repeat protein [Candidatus Daviesbacteria bacterium]
FILLFVFLRNRFDIKNILLMIFGVALALLNVRSFPYLVFLTLPAVLNFLPPIKPNKVKNYISLFFALLLLLESFFYLNKSYYKYTDSQYQPGLKLVESAKGAVDFALDNNLPQPFYNNFDIGSYLIYRGFPVYKVFVDGRPEAYPKKFFQEVYIPSQSDYSKFKQLEQSLNLETVIFSHTDQTPWGRSFLQAISRDNSYAVAFVDDYMVVFVKKSVLEDQRLYEITSEKITPEFFRFENHLSYIRMGMFLLNTGQTENARKFLEKALEVFPNSPTANLLMSQINPFMQKYQQNSKNPFFW